MKFRLSRTLGLAVMVSLALNVGCKRDVGVSPTSAGSGTGRSSTSAGESGSAVGSGSVSAVGNEVTYQNVHVQVPWNVSNPVMLMKIAQDAAGGKGLKLGNGNMTLEISSDGRFLRLNGRDYGALRPMDRVVLTPEGTLTVNGRQRTPAPATTQA